VALPKSKHPVTKVNATGYSFTHSDATGFPRALPPIRKIGLGRRAVAGLIPSEKLEQGGIARFESSLERDFFVLLEFSSDVTRWDPQPVRLDVEGCRPYVPDVLVSFLPPGRMVGDGHQILYEVKYRDELRKRWTEYKPRFKAARRYAKSRGWRFKIITEREIRGSGLLWNAKFLLPYRLDTGSYEDELLLLNRLKLVGATTPGDLLAQCSNDPWERARLLTIFWHLVSVRRVGIDLCLQISMTSAIWPNE
jgi:hypothetical protein